MLKWCLCITEEREICEPKFYDTFEEAYAAMKESLVNNIKNSHNTEKYLGENDEILNVDEANEEGMLYITPANPDAQISAMWSNLNSSYNLDARVYRLNIV